MSDTLTVAERMIDLEVRMPSLRQAAEAEAAAKAANAQTNPWAGASRRLADAEAELSQARLEDRGRKLLEAKRQHDEISAQLSCAMTRSRGADYVVQQMEENATIKKWKAAPWIATDKGYRYAWDQLRSWVASGRPRGAVGPAGAYLLDANFPHELSFDSQERESVRQYESARHQAQVAALDWERLRNEQAQLLNKWPELRSVT